MAHSQEKYFYAEKPGPMKLGAENVVDSDGVARPGGGANEWKQGATSGPDVGITDSRPGGMENLSSSGEGSETPFARPGGVQQIKR